MEITFDRLKHSLAVAKKMKRIAESSPEKYSATPDELFLLGILHDIGYEFCENQEEHNTAGAILLKSEGYKYWQEVYYHGIPQTSYNTPELCLLNYVDMTIGPDGAEMTIEERLSDIAYRYGSDSAQYTEALKLSILIRESFIPATDD